MNILMHGSHLYVIIYTNYKLLEIVTTLHTGSSAIADRPRCRVVSFGQQWKTETGRQYFVDIIIIIIIT